MAVRRWLRERDEAVRRWLCDDCATMAVRRWLCDDGCATMENRCRTNGGKLLLVNAGNPLYNVQTWELLAMKFRLSRRIFNASVVSTLAIGSTATALAEPPSILKIFRSKQSLPDESLELKVEHGPWMILAYSFPGSDGKSKAIELAREIRQALKQPAFVMERTSGVTSTLARRERIRNDDNGNPLSVALEARYANGGQESVYVVLVGEFTSIDDPRVADVLEDVRFAKPVSLGEDPKSSTAGSDKTQSSNFLVQQYRAIMWKRNDRKDDYGKMGAAFVTRNPLLPDDYFEAPKVDDFVANLNKDVEFSLLDCPGKFTVRVASFSGRQVHDFGIGTKGSKLEEISDQLDKAAMDAHVLTTALRKQGVEAYEFHDRTGSYVMVGSFDSLGQEVTAGQFQYHPGILEINQKWCGYRVVEAQDRRTGAKGKTTTLNRLENIPFDIEGKPMAVPRLATSKLYSGSLLGNR